MAAAAGVDLSTAQSLVGASAVSQCENQHDVVTYCVKCDKTHDTLSDAVVCGPGPTEYVDAGPCSEGSVIDNHLMNHIHEAIDWQVPDSQPGCKKCGSTTSGISTVPMLQLARRHRFRDMTDGGSYGPGVFCNFDANLRLYGNTTSGNRAFLFNPSDLTYVGLHDGCDGDSPRDGLYTDPITKQGVKLQLFDSTGKLATDVNQASYAIANKCSGSKLRFDIVNLNCPPVLGLAAQWKLDESQGLTVGDAQGAYPGTLTGAGKWIMGRDGNALNLSGGFVQVSSLNNLLNATASLSFWMRTKQTGSSATATAPGVAGVEPVSGGDQVAWGYLDGGRIGIKTGGTTSSRSIKSVADGQWQEVLSNPVD